MEGRQEEPATTLDGKKSMAELTEAKIDTCCITTETEEKINPIAQCQSSDSDAFSGRMLFKGVDLAFITVDEHQMFALNEILDKLLPTTPRTTVCARLERMNAPRHLCTKQEVRKMKALGGAKPNAVNCTLVARRHVVEYCDKFKDKLQKETSSRARKNDVKNTPACLNNLQINTSMSAAVHISDETMKSTSVADNDMVLGTNGLVEDEVKDCLQARKSCEGECNKEDNETTKQTEFQTGKNSAKQSIDPKLSDSVSRCGAGLISQLPEPGETVDKCDQQAKNAFNKRFSHLKRKRKRRTNLEILQSFNSEIGSDKILNNKRQRNICNAKGNGSYAEKKVVKKRQHSTVNDTSQNPPTFHLDSVVSNSSNKQSNPRSLQALNLEYVVNDESGEKVCYFDQNNNEVDMLPPRSPTLLLKRSVINNEWRIAKTTLPCGLNFDDEGQKSSEPYERLLKVESSSESCASSSSNFACSTTSGQQPPEQISSQSILTSRPINKRKNSKTIGRCALAKKFGRVKKKKNETTTMKLVDEQENKANEVTHSRLNVPSNPNYKSVTFNENHRSIGKAPSSSNNVSKNVSTNKSKKKDFETTDNADKSKQVNKSNDVVNNKSKPRRRVMNAFRLVETLPYSSFLMIKDGDLCPSYTMAYNSTKHIPGCCHPLWRWRLGKPVPLSLKQPQTNKSSPGESSEQQSGENCEKERSVVEVKNDEVPSKESIDRQPVGVL